MTRVLAWRRSSMIRLLLAYEATGEVSRNDRRLVASWLTYAFDFATTPEGSHYWHDMVSYIRHGDVELTDELRAKLVAIMLMPVKEGREDL